MWDFYTQKCRDSLCRLWGSPAFLRSPCAWRWRDSADERAQMRSALQAYKYVAPDLSLAERNGLDQYWTFMTTHVYPRWLAPNVLTLSGGGCIGAATLLTLAYSPGLAGTAPRWVYAANAGLILCYQTLDGSDGKQARQTSSGSPVGELLDHGIDAWATGCIVFVCLDAFAFGLGSPWPWLIFVGAQSAFFASNLTLLHTGRMRVDDMGVIELQSVMCACLAVTAALSPAVWKLPSPPALGGWQLREVLGAGVVGAMVVAVGSAMWDVARAPAADVRHGGQRVRDSTATSAAWKQCATVGTYICCVALALSSPSCRRDEAMLRLLWMCANSAFAELMCRLLVKRLAQRSTPLFAPGLQALAAFAGMARTGIGGIGACAAAAAVATVTHAAYFAWAVHASASALGIHVFRVRGASSWWRL